MHLVFWEKYTKVSENLGISGFDITRFDCISINNWIIILFNLKFS